MNFSTRFKRGLYVSFLVPSLLAIQPTKAHAEPMSFVTTLIVGSVCTSTVLYLADYFNIYPNREYCYHCNGRIIKDKYNNLCSGIIESTEDFVQ